ncbi:hypothetical protein GCM10027284_31970 [Cyclobacterium sediminis]
MGWVDVPFVSWPKIFYFQFPDKKQYLVIKEFDWNFAIILKPYSLYKGLRTTAQKNQPSPI